jgi:RNA polymerase sigma-70 factor (ECF subfamily)
MQLRSDKASVERDKKWTLQQENFVESEETLHPLDGSSPDTDKALKDCIEKLKNEQKQCIQLFYFEDRCYRDIAELTGMDEKKVKSHLQNGKRNLKLCLENKNVRPEET